MKANVRNQFTGIVKRVKSGDADGGVTIMLLDGYELATMITCESCNGLGLNVDSVIITLIKPVVIITATDLEHIKLSARNRLNGLICEVEREVANSVITMDLGNGLRLMTGAALQSTEQLNLHPGQRATAILKTGGVVLDMLVQGRGIDILSACCKIFRHILWMEAVGCIKYQLNQNTSCFGDLSSK